MNLQQTTIFEIILYIIMILSMIELFIGMCINNNTIIVLFTIYIFVILFIFLIINTYRFIKYKRK